VSRKLKSAASNFTRPDRHKEILNKYLNILDFKLSQCSERCILYFGWFSGVWETSAHKIQSPGNHPKERMQQVFNYCL